MYLDTKNMPVRNSIRLGRFNLKSEKWKKSSLEQNSYFQMCSWVPLLCMDEARKQDRVPDKEDGSVVPHQVPVALLGVVLDSKAPGVSGSVS